MHNDDHLINLLFNYRLFNLYKLRCSSFLSYYWRIYLNFFIHKKFY